MTVPFNYDVDVTLTCDSSSTTGKCTIFVDFSIYYIGPILDPVTMATTYQKIYYVNPTTTTMSAPCGGTSMTHIGGGTVNIGLVSGRPQTVTLSVKA